MRYLLDTNHASPLVTLNHPLRQRILQSINQGDSFAVCVPAVTETLFGIGMLRRAEQNRTEWQRLRYFLPCYVPDENDAVVAAELQVSLRKRGWQLETVDAFIATLAIRYDFVLLTTDRDFRAVPNLQHENWLRAVTDN
jgi:tRNA(fMet)-specific endonuclease VapC